jgi:hypothetical protein
MHLEHSVNPSGSTFSKIEGKQTWEMAVTYAWLETINILEPFHNFSRNLLFRIEVVENTVIFAKHMICFCYVDHLFLGFYFWTNCDCRKWNLPDGSRSVSECNNHWIVVPVAPNIVDCSATGEERNDKSQHPKESEKILSLQWYVVFNRFSIPLEPGSILLAHILKSMHRADVCIVGE